MVGGTGGVNPWRASVPASRAFPRRRPLPPKRPAAGAPPLPVLLYATMSGTTESGA
jgi:hypothetical protein